jgi:ABC-type uncharacterized transport system fused permease/ATPase subunit
MQLDAARGNIMGDTWRTAKAYWTSEEKWSALGLLVAIITLNLCNVYIAALAGELDSVENWPQRLSQAEEQQLAFARILLVKPALVFPDDATSALDDPSEAQLYRLLRAAPWRPTIVSASYKSSLAKFHDEVLDISAFHPSREYSATGGKQ